MRKYSQCSDKVFYLALAVAGFCTLCTVIFLSDIYRDTAHVYAVYAREIGNGNWSAGIVQRAPMLNITLAGLLAYCGLEAVKALSLVAGVFYLLTCFPLRRLLERYVSPLAAAWGCVLYVTAPKMIRFACAPLLESTRIFFLVAAVLYFLRCSEEPKWKNAILLGISAGFLSVSRGEGILVSLALLGGLPFFVLLFRRPVNWGKQAAVWLLAIICAFCSVTPFCGMNYSKSGYFVQDMRLVQVFDTIKRVFVPADNVNTPVSQAFMSEEEGNGSWGEKTVNCFSGAIRGGYEPYWLLALCGAIIMLRKRQLKDDYLVLLGVTVLQCASYFLIVSSYRYYLFVIPLFMMFTVTGAEQIRCWVLKYVPGKVHIFCAIAVAVVLAGQTANGLKRAFSSKGKDFQAAGKWIAEYGKKHFPERKLIIFAPQMTETAYWSKAIHTDGYEKKQHDPATFKDFDLAVVHRKKSFGMEKRTDLERIPNTPHSKNIWIFKVKKQENK